MPPRDPVPLLSERFLQTPAALGLRTIEGTDGCFDNPAAVRKWLKKIAQSDVLAAEETAKKKVRAGA